MGANIVRGARAEARASGAKVRDGPAGYFLGAAGGEAGALGDGGGAPWPPPMPNMAGSNGLACLVMAGLAPLPVADSSRVMPRGGPPGPAGASALGVIVILTRPSGGIVSLIQVSTVPCSILSR